MKSDIKKITSYEKMNKYKIYSTNDGVHVAIKIGWSWTGFFLVICTYTAVIGIIEVFSSSLFATDKIHTICMFLFIFTGFSFAIILGVKDNKIKENELKKKNYYFKKIISDTNEDMAVYNYIKKKNKWTINLNRQE